MDMNGQQAGLMGMPTDTKEAPEETLPAPSDITYETAFSTLSDFLDAGLRIMELPRQITPGVIPAGTTEVNWTINNGLDAPFETEYIEGVVLCIINGRSAFPFALGHGPAGPSSCQSYDGITGHGNPGGDCATCPLADRNYRPRDDEPRCSERTWLIIQQVGQMLPTVILIPITSIDAIKQYEIALLQAKGKRVWQVVTRLRLTPHVTARGRHVARIMPRLGSYEEKMPMATGLELHKQIRADFIRSVESVQDLTQVVR